MLEEEHLPVVAVDERVGRQIEIAHILQLDDAVLVGLMPLLAIEDAVAESEETLLLPAELLDKDCCVHIGEEETLHLL